MDGSGNLYGTTSSGGTGGTGTVFKVVTGSGAITTLASFSGSDGTPAGGLVMDASGNLYGTTTYGGADNAGTVFEVAKGSSTIATLHAFDGTDGSLPLGGLIMDASGNLYGTTSSGGAGGEGAVFELSPSAAAPTVTGISPAAGAMSGGTTVTITGTNLAGATAVMFGNVAATSFTVNSNTQIMATSPAGTAITASTVDVTVVTAGGTSTTSSADQFAYVLPPVITGISPASGPEAGGTTVIITGINLTGATSVNFFGMEMEASSFTVNSATQITATSPNGASFSSK